MHINDKEQKGNIWIPESLRAWRMPILFVSIIALGIGFLFSMPLFIAPKYESSVVMLPASTRSLAEALLSSNIWSETDLLEFGERRQADQLIQVLESNRIQNRIVDHFDLWTHYKIEKGLPFAKTRLLREYEKNIQFKRTEFNAVEVTVFDRNPQIAADIANHIAALLDSSIHAMQEVRAQKAIEVTEHTYKEKEHYIQVLEDSLALIMAMGVHDYKSQAQVLYEQLALQLARQQVSSVRAIEAQLDKLAKLGGPYVSIMTELKLEKERLSHLKAKVEKARMDAVQDLPQKFIVSDAFPAERKSYPLQWAIMLGSVLSSILFMIILILFYPRVNSLIKKSRSRANPQLTLSETGY